MTCHSHTSATVATDSWHIGNATNIRCHLLFQKLNLLLWVQNFQWKDDAHATCVWYMPIDFHMQSQMLKFFTQEREQTPWTTHHPMWAHGAPLWEICPCWPINPTQLHQRGCTLDEHRPQPPWTNANVEVVGPFDTKKSKSKFHVSKRTTMLIHGFCDSISGVKHRALLSNYLNWIMILE